MTEAEGPFVDDVIWKEAAPLLDAWRDGTLTDSDRERLLQLLRRHYQFRRQVVADLGLQALLQEQQHERPNAERLADNVLHVVANSNRHRVQAAVIDFPNRQRRAYQTSVWIAAAAMLVVGILTFTALATQPAQPVSIITSAAMSEPARTSTGWQAPVLSGTILAGPSRDQLQPVAAGGTITFPCEVALLDSAARIGLPEDGHLELQAGSRCAISAAASNIVVHHGEIRAELTGSRWLLTPHTLGWVTGSTVTVAVNGQRTTASCEAGKARFDSWAGEQHELEAGASGEFVGRQAPVASRLVLASLGATPSQQATGQGLQLAAGSSHVFSVQVRDQFDRPMDHADLTSWAATGGTLQQSTGASVRFNADSSGTATLIVNHAGLTARQTVIVTP